MGRATSAEFIFFSVLGLSMIFYLMSVLGLSMIFYLANQR